MKRLKGKWVRAIAGVMASLAVFFALAGCDGSSEADNRPAPAPRGTPPTALNSPSTRPATRPVATPAKAEPESFLYFEFPKRLTPNGTPADPIPRQFPAARLRLTSKPGEPVVAMLFSDDPKDAISPNWKGSRYYFSMTLPVNDLASVDGAKWWWQTSAGGSEEETPNGVFLQGDRVRLEPVNVVLQFDGQPPRVAVNVSGEFLMRDIANPSQPPESVYINGYLMPKVETKD